MQQIQALSDSFKTIDLKAFLRSTLNRNLFGKLAAIGLVGYGVFYFGLTLNRKIYRSYGFFKKRGVKTPPYSFLFGNFLEIKEKGYAETLVKWTKKYGKTYGYYEGHLPVLVTSDLELIDEIFYKQFANFSARKRLLLQISDDSPDLNVFSASRNRWKRLRTISNQTFSPAKLKELLPTMRTCSDRLINHISRNMNKEINITELFDLMTMDVVWNCAFGIDIDLINNPNFSYYAKIRQLLDGFANYNLLSRILIYFYEFKPIVLISTLLSSLILSKFDSRLGNPFFWLRSRAFEVIDERSSGKKNNVKHDFVQLLIEAEAEQINLDLDNKSYSSTNTKLIEKKMSRREILASLIGLMLGGFDTTASTINFCFHALLAYPDELAKVQDEVDSLESFDYDSINKLEYLEMFIKEVMRMYPPAIAVQNRRCTKETTLNGIAIPENLLVSVDVVSLHYDPENWPGTDPNVFYPMRFSPNASYNKLAYMPFGAGPRICLGMRFALIELKLTLAKILKNFDITPTRTIHERPITQDGIVAVVRISEPIYAKFSKRNVQN